MITSQTSKSAAIENTDCPIFLRKTYHLIDTCDQSVAGWSEDGTSFLVRNVQVLASKCLPQYFKHNQFSSFVRQLNFYGFRKEKNEFVRVINENDNEERHWQFRHEYFVRGKPELMSKITRRIPNKGTNRGAHDLNSTQVHGATAINNLNEDDKNECQTLKSEISSLEDKLHAMETSLDQLSKKLSTINLSKEKTSTENTSKTTINVNQPIVSKKRTKFNNIESHITKNIVRPENITSAQTELVIRGSAQRSHGVPPAVFTKASDNIHFSRSTINSLASNVLPDLSVATDKDLLMEDVTRSSLSRSSSVALGSEGSHSILDIPLDDIDDLVASISGYEGSSTITMSRKEEIGSTVSQMLPSLIPPENCSLQSQATKIRTEANTVDRLLKKLSKEKRVEFVNNVLKEMSTVYGDAESTPDKQLTYKLELALQCILSYYGKSKGIKEESSSNQSEKNSSSKSSFVKIEVGS